MGSSRQTGTANLTEVSSQTPYEGTQHYRFEYAFTGSWAGLGLNMDNWGANAPRNFSGYSHLRIAYRGLSGAQTLTLSLHSCLKIIGFFCLLQNTIQPIPVFI